MFDIIKNKINKFLIKGLENIDKNDYSRMVELKEKLSSMNLDIIANSLEFFLDSLNMLTTNKNNKEIRSDVSIKALKVLTTLRVFETIMSVELIKKALL